jgi:hypothetical protein
MYLYLDMDGVVVFLSWLKVIGDRGQNRVVDADSETETV